MTRSGALALLAAGSLRGGSLLEYVPGESLILNHKLLNLDAVRPKFAPEHTFRAGALECTVPSAVVRKGETSWGYYVDEDAA